MVKRASRPVQALLILFIVGYGAFFSVQLILHYHSFGSRALDLGNIGQAIWNTSQGNFFHQTTQPGITNRLSLHVEPILIPISLLYYLYSGPEILFIFQSIVVALGAIPVFALAYHKLNNQGLALIFALVYLMLPAVQGATLLDFHAVTLAPTFMLAAFYYLETGRPKPFALFAVLAVACKEDITLLILMMGLYAIFINRQYRLGLATVGACLGWAFLAVFVIPPAFANTQNIHWGRYDHLGSSPANIVLNMVLQPALFLEHLQKVDALNYFRLLLAPTAFTALLNPATLLLALPSLGVNLLSNFPPMQEVNLLIYAAPVMPAVIISSIYGVDNLNRFVDWAVKKTDERRRTKDEDHASRSTQHAARNTQHATRNTPYEPLFNLALAAILLTASLIYHANHGYLPGGGQFRGWEEVTDHHRRAQRIFEQIPAQAAVSAGDRLVPHVSRRKTLYIFDRIDDADHILLDVTLDSWPLHPVALRHRVDQLLAGDFGIVDAFDGTLLLAKNQPNLPTTLPDSFFNFARVNQPQSFTPQFPARVTFDDRLQLLGYSLSLGAHEQALPVITLYWRALKPLEDDYTLWPFFINRNGQPIADPAERPLVATLWYPTSRWKPDEIIMTRTLPQNLAPNLGDEFTLAVGVTNSTWAEPSQRLAVTQSDDDLYLFENNTWARLGSFRRVGRKTYEPLSQNIDPPRQPHEVQFRNIINLQGVELPPGPLAPGDEIPFALYWQSVTPITVDLTTFAHLRDSAGNTVTQLDWTPQDSLGYLPTTAWQPGRMVVDKQTISLPESLPPGKYELVVGWYHAPTGERVGESKIGVITVQ